ncbi:hypothetical protein HNO88_001652 [Novosphingobium chloroacetimidivorans]|uniref:Uncharacterized protein n=1 Tax=Novosphingobium chloroacetimidivorans TaxID=1428314 RepID=A0A7W7KA48_9SPHN|nr:hypothetical protein [Novosphingobium chloroacetimidivorans]MBB4858333.1 hypothetical protein [Novosphingobium chloroacetimidivorans]
MLLLIGTPLAAQSPSDLSDLVGARGAGGESELQRRGYVFVRTQEGDDRKWSNWWNPARRQCVTVVTMNGRYDSITATPAPDCNQQAKSAQADRGRGARPRPDLGYGAPAPQVGSASYADRDRGSQYRSDAGLGLVCFGDGQRPRAATSTGWTWNSSSRRYDYGSRTQLTQEHFDASLMLQLDGNSGQIRLPKKLIPPLHSRGQDDWWQLDNVVIGADTISARYRLNGLNKPRLTVDRRSGRITVVGSGDYAFRGSCDLVDDAQQRRF